RAPLIRYGTSFVLSNTFLEEGGEVIVGVPQLYVETSLGRPSDEGIQQRERGLDTVVRVQGYVRDLILGVSYLNSGRTELRNFAAGRMAFRGIDGRWMYRGVELRGEWIDGRPFVGVFSPVSTRGGYLDAIVHEPFMGPVTAVARVEKLDYPAGQFSAFLKRFTAGARVRVTPWLVAQANFVRQPGGLADGRDQAMDVAFTVTRRF